MCLAHEGIAGKPAGAEGGWKGSRKGGHRVRGTRWRSTWKALVRTSDFALSTMRVFSSLE